MGKIYLSIIFAADFLIPQNGSNRENSDIYEIFLNINRWFEIKLNKSKKNYTLAIPFFFNLWYTVIIIIFS